MIFSWNFVGKFGNSLPTSLPSKLVWPRSLWWLHWPPRGHDPMQWTGLLVPCGPLSPRSPGFAGPQNQPAFLQYSYTSAVHKTNQRHRKLKQFAVNKTHLCCTHRSKILHVAWIFRCFQSKKPAKCTTVIHTVHAKKGPRWYTATHSCSYTSIKRRRSGPRHLDKGWMRNILLMASSEIRMSLTSYSWGEGKTVYPAIFISHY